MKQKNTLRRAVTYCESGSPLLGKILSDYVLHKSALRVECKNNENDAVIREVGCCRTLARGLGKLHPEDLGSLTINSYRQQRSKGLLSGSKVQAKNSTIRRELTVLVAALNHACRQLVIPPRSWPMITMPPASKPKSVVLEASELKTLIDCAVGRGKLFIQIASETAARRRSIETLRWEQVDLENRMIHFHDDIQTNKRKVPVPVSDRLLPLLQAEKDASGTTFVMGGNAQLYGHFKRACEKALKLTGNSKFKAVSPHTLRHSWATRAARAGVDLYQIAGVLGDSMQTVTENYLHHCPEHLRSAVNFS